MTCEAFSSASVASELLGEKPLGLGEKPLVLGEQPLAEKRLVEQALVVLLLPKVVGLES